MFLFYDYPIAFLHIPKTGGRWIKKVLTECGLGEEIEFYNKDISSRHYLPVLRMGRAMFTFVRHPLGWYESWWKSSAGDWRTHDEGRWHPQRVLWNCRSDDFNEFVTCALEQQPAYVTRLYEWYCGPTGFSYVNHVGRYENLKYDLKYILAQENVTLTDKMHNIIDSTPPFNVSPSRLGQPIWNEDTRDRAMALEREAISRFYTSW